MGTELRNMDGI